LRSTAAAIPLGISECPNPEGNEAAESSGTTTARSKSLRIIGAFRPFGNGCAAWSESRQELIREWLGRQQAGKPVGRFAGVQNSAFAASEQGEGHFDLGQEQGAGHVNCDAGHCRTGRVSLRLVTQFRPPLLV
jgi:hypothetical protein